MIVFGAGALGTFVGARLARAGSRVVFVDPWREAVETIQARGLRLEEAGDVWSGAAEATGDVGDVLRASGPAPLVIVAVKSQVTSAIAPDAARAAAPEGIVLTLQNGLGNRGTLAASAGSERVLLGLAFLGATLLGPGHVRHGGGRRIVLTQADVPVERVTPVAHRLESAGFECPITRDAGQVLWRKLAVNCAINPLTALLGVTNGALLQDTAAVARLTAAAREVAAVARRLGIDVGDATGEVFAAATLEAARETGANRSSMLQDVTRGVATEIEALNGAVVHEAERLGIAVPVNRALLEELRALEARRAGGRVQ